MQTFARIAGGTVAELIQVEGDAPIDTLFHPDLVATLVPVPEDSVVAEGWQWDEAGFALPAAPPPAPLGDVTARQLRLWLLSQGRSLSEVDMAIAAMPAPGRAAAQVEWEYATSYHRAHPLIGALGAALGFSAAQIDEGFRAAALL